MVFSHIEVFDPYGIWNSQNRNKTETFVIDSFNTPYVHTYCPDPDLDEDIFTPDTFSQTCYRTIGYDIYTDFSNSNIGILGNTQNKNLTDEQKVNNYLSWYFTGTPQIGDRIPLDPQEQEDMDRLVNFSGPIRKLLPYDAMRAIREVLIDAVDDRSGDIHDYALNTQSTVRLSNITDEMFEYFPNIPNSTVEDVAGEAFFSANAPGVGAQLNPEYGISTAPSSVIITCGVGAHMSCAPSGVHTVNCRPSGVLCPSSVQCCSTNCLGDIFVIIEKGKAFQHDQRC